MPFKEINISEIIKQECEQDPEFKKAWESSRMEHVILGQLISLRKQQKLSQGQLASKMNSSQQAISRVENKEVKPSLRMVCNMADSLGYELKLVPKK